MSPTFLMQKKLIFPIFNVSILPAACREHVFYKKLVAKWLLMNHLTAFRLSRGGNCIRISTPCADKRLQEMCYNLWLLDLLHIPTKLPEIHLSLFRITVYVDNRS